MRKETTGPHIFEIKIIAVGVVTFSILATCTVLQMVLFTVLIDCDFKKTVANGQRNVSVYLLHSIIRSRTCTTRCYDLCDAKGPGCLGQILDLCDEEDWQ